MLSISPKTQKLFASQSKNPERKSNQLSTMFKRKEVGSSSSFSGVMNPEKFHNFAAKLSYGGAGIPNFKKQERIQAMNKGKEVVSSSDCSEVINPRKFHDSTADSSCGFAQIPNFKKRGKSEGLNNRCFQKKRVSAANPDLGAGIKVEFFNVQVNGAPFYDFFAKAGKRDSERDGKIDEADVPVIKRRRVLATRFDLKISEKNVSDHSPSSSFSYSDCAPVMSQSSVSDCVNSGKGKVSMGSSVSCEGCSSSGTSTGFEAPVDAVPLSMYYPDPYPLEEVEWRVKKTLRASDCNQQYRLLIGRKLVEDQILSHLDQESQLKVSTLVGLRVDVLDCDTGLQVKLTLKKWMSTGCYALMDSWKNDFVRRRGLHPGDQVGLCWDERHNRLLFSVLSEVSVTDH